MTDESRSPPRSGELRFLAKHSVVYGIGNMLSRIVAFLMLPLYTSQLTPFDYGVLEIIDTSINMVGLVAGLGVAGAMTRFYFEYTERTDQDRVISTIYILVTVTGALIIGVCALGSTFLAEALFDSPQFASYFHVAFASLLIGLIVDLGQVYLRIQQRSMIYVGISLTNLLLSVSLNIYFVLFAKEGVFGILLASLITKIVIAVPLTVAILRKVGMAFSKALAGDMYRFSLPLIPSELASTAIAYSDRYFINHMLSTADAGIYGLAQKLGTVVHTLVTAPFLLTYLPRRFEIAKQDDAPRTLARVFDYHMLLLVIVTMGLAFYAREVLMIMTTPAYYPAAQYIPVIGLSMIVLAMKYHFQFGILYSKQTKYMAHVNITSAVAHVTLNAALIPLLGLWGALAASLAAYTCNTVLSLKKAQPLFAIRYDFGRLLKLLVLAILFAGAGAMVQLGVVAGIVVKAILFVAFIGALLATGVVTPQERQLVVEQVGSLRARISRRGAQ
ncbi:O-antigen/teichoic acid export membrane protein [Povalibacter uvarum]|uniref:O-antigen/teichoic acid export membrane protein n=1 Tax=Povalibacter uvarum TaxID=732238 RepID=A0A841HFJ4_9GAMM|nr:oligosaccharide flippase family protein [Povalibacter uvarum]MBB6091647.1 O-antigen/teichoic acid export membrane protein [Povalibacter uvarum]